MAARGIGAETRALAVAVVEVAREASTEAFEESLHALAPRSLRRLSCCLALPSLTYALVTRAHFDTASSLLLCFSTPTRNQLV